MTRERSDPTSTNPPTRGRCSQGRGGSTADAWRRVRLRQAADYAAGRSRRGRPRDGPQPNTCIIAQVTDNGDQSPRMTLRPSTIRNARTATSISSSSPGSSNAAQHPTARPRWLATTRQGSSGSGSWTLSSSCSTHRHASTRSRRSTASRTIAAARTARSVRRFTGHHAEVGRPRAGEEPILNRPSSGLRERRAPRGWPREPRRPTPPVDTPQARAAPQHRHPPRSRSRPRVRRPPRRKRRRRVGLDVRAPRRSSTPNSFVGGHQQTMFGDETSRHRGLGRRWRRFLWISRSRGHHPLV